MYNAKYYNGQSVTMVNTLASRNKVDLRAIVMVETKKISHYEIYVENVFFTRYDNEKTAKKMWKDFSAAA